MAARGRGAVGAGLRAKQPGGCRGSAHADGERGLCERTVPSSALENKRTDVRRCLLRKICAVDAGEASSVPKVFFLRVIGP